jgi:hypothetical protein
VKRGALSGQGAEKQRRRSRMKITGTFLDEITCDIPSANWGRKEWAEEFDTMKSAGIDTVIMIRVGYKNILGFPSESVRKHIRLLPVYDDLVGLFLDEAGRCGMDFYFGTYDSGEFWHKGDYGREIDINLGIIDEVFKKHGKHKALKGWYISHEIDAFNESAMKVYEKLAARLKKLKELPILISPYPRGGKEFSKPLTPEQHRRQWDRVFSRLRGLVDIVAFQDGQMHFDELTDFLRINCELAEKYDIRCWSNVESFNRDMPIRFPPISWPKLRYKMEEAAKTGVEKLITFEFSHFMSPNSIYPAAHNLYKRYMEWIKKGK